MNEQKYSFFCELIENHLVKKIYLIRHGQTDYNLNGIIQGGRVDTDLNATGREQASSFYDHYNRVIFDKIYTSVLKRTIQTIEPFRVHSIPIESYAELNEIDWGVDEGISLKDSQSKYYYEVIEAWKNGNIDLQIKGGESPIDVSTRLKKIIAIILSRKEEESILICTHGRILRILLCMLLNYDLKYMDLFIHQNVCLYTLIHTGSFFKLEQFCDIDHLIS